MDMMTEEMIEHELIQGTPEWLDFRMNHDGASEAAAMLGISKKMSRNELLRMKSSGITKEFSDWVQKNILDYGHEVEALARPIVEKLLGTKLYPVVCSRGRMSASCDGKNMAGTIVWEHKQWNKELAASVSSGVLPDEHWPQVQQVLMVTGADRCIFTVSDGTEDNMVSMEVFPDPEKFETLRAGWAQFNKDRETYVHVEVAEMPKAEVSIELPALFVHAKGQITEHNMEAFDLALTAKLSEVRAIALVTDRDFSNAKEAAKKFRETAKAIKLSKDAMLAQTETIGEAARKMDAWSKDLNETALQLEKDVTKEDLKKKEAMINAATISFSAHVEALESETRPIRLNVHKPDFAGAIKGKSKYASMQDAIDSSLANGTIAADAVAKDVRAKLAWCKEHAAGMSALFPDLQVLMAKPMDDFTLVISSRIDKQKADDAARIEAERARIQAEEEAKARAKVEAESKIAEAARAKLEAEAKAEEEAALADENALIASLWENARRIEFNSVPYINKAISYFESGAKDWKNDSRPRVAAAVAEARKEMQGKLAEAIEASRKAVALAEQEAALAKTHTPPESQAVTLDGAQPSLVKTELAAPVAANVSPIRKAAVQLPSDGEVIECLRTTFGLSFADVLDLMEAVVSRSTVAA